MNQPTIHYNPRGYEAAYDPAANICTVTVRGYKAPDGRIVERGGPLHAEDKRITTFRIKGIDGQSASGQPSPVRETFHDALRDQRDLLGAPMFRNKPADDAERRLFAAAYDAAQKIRAKTTVLGVDKVIFSLNPSMSAVADCFARDAAGSFWLMFCAIAPFGKPGVDVRNTFGQVPVLSAYILEAGEYVPANATIRLGAWTIAPAGQRFTEIPNDRIAARDAVIKRLLTPPF